MAIVVVTREDGSGTRSSFESAIGITAGEVTQSATVAQGNGTVATTVISNPAAIGYTSLEVFNKNEASLKALSVDGFAATDENIISGDYPVSLALSILFHQKNLNEVEQAFID